MNKSLSGVKVAMLVANGFSQGDMVAAQKALIAAGANVRVVSPENGIVNGWEGQGWGHHFAIDAQLSSALAADYSVLVVPGGQKSMEKLNLTGHTRRFINGFIEAGKPTIVMDSALHILILTGNIAGRRVAGPQDMRDVIVQAGGVWDEAVSCRDENILTGATGDAAARDAVVTAMLDCVAETLYDDVKEDKAA